MLRLLELFVAHDKIDNPEYTRKMHFCERLLSKKYFVNVNMKFSYNTSFFT